MARAWPAAPPLPGLRWHGAKQLWGRFVLVAAAALAALLTFQGAASGEPWVSARGGRVHLEGDGTTLLVRATLNGRVSGLFLLDTGSTYCVITPATAAALGLPRPHNREQVDLQTANGVVSAPLVRIRTLDIDGVRRRDVKAVVHAAVPAPLAGVIGLNFLNNYRYSVDADRHTLVLR